MFLEDKIDFLVLYLIAQPLQKLFRPLLHAIFKVRAAPVLVLPDNQVEAAADMACLLQDKAARIWPTVAITQTVKDAGLSESMAGSPQQVHAPSHTAASDPSLQHDNAKVSSCTTLDIRLMHVWRWVITSVWHAGCRAWSGSPSRT